jgi:hypothetical protein
MAKKKQKKGGRRPGKARRRGRSRVGALGGVQLETLAGVAAGAVASKALNGVTAKIDFVQNKPIVLPIVKGGLGYLMLAYSKNPFVQNMGLGFVAEGALQGLEVAAPQVFKKLVGDGVGHVGSTLIDLDDIGGYSDSMDVDHGVAGVYDDNMVGGAV